MPNEKKGRVYEVGYRRPPRHTQFRKGNAGSAGRTRGSRNLATLVMTTLNEPVTVNENGRRKTISKLRASLKQLVNKAAAGDSRALQLLLATVRQIAEPEAPARTAVVNEADRQVIEQVVARIRAINERSRRVSKPIATDQILTPAEYQAVLRQDLVAFIQRCFHELNPQTRFLWNWHIEVLAAKLTAVRGGKITRLIINIPPRHLKSLCASVALPAWWLGHDPAVQILCVSYAQDLSDKLSRDTRSIMNTDWYQGLFPTRLAADKQSVQEFVTTAQGHRLATSVGGVLTGRGADLLIIDDPLKPDEAVSEAQRKKANEWYDNTLYSRLNDKQHGRIILIMQRLHEDDLVGHVLKQEDWEVVSFPAIAEKDEDHTIDTAFGEFRIRRRAGDLLHPERESRETLERIRRTIGEYNFAGPVSAGASPVGGRHHQGSRLQALWPGGSAGQLGPGDSKLGYC